jgi:hypothetical protein
MVGLLGFDTEASFDKWRESELVKPLWDLFVAKALDTGISARGKKCADHQNLCDWIREGEKGGKRRFSDREPPKFDHDMDWHAWLTYWLVQDNVSDCHGCFFNRRLDRNEMYKHAYHFVVWAKRQRSRSGAAKLLKSTDNQNTRTGSTHASEESEADDIDMDPNSGVVWVKWTEGMSTDLIAAGYAERITVQSFCGYSILEFWRYVDDQFHLGQHLQRRMLLYVSDNLTFKEAQHHAHETGKPVLFFLVTESASLPEEAETVPPSGMPILDEDGGEETEHGSSRP